MSTRFPRAIAFISLVLLPLWGMAAPQIFYTDIVTGPNTGGEGGNGAYLTIFGAGFGAAQLTSTVTINSLPVAVYKQWSDTKITVQPGPAVSTGPIAVSVAGQSSNTQPFTVVAGKIYFVAQTGSDTTGLAGDITKPFRTINRIIDNFIQPGDHVVVRGGNWTDVYNQFGSFFSIYQKSGTAAAPLVFMGYPTETVNFVRTTHSRGIHSFNTSGHWVIANFHVDGRPIGIEPGCTDIRIVNNEIKNFFENSGGAAALEGSGKQFRIFGNHVHDNSGSKLYHAIYFDGRDTGGGGPNDIEIAYNHIHHQKGGRGIQIFGDTQVLINNVRVHHNLIHNIHLDGILFGSRSGTGFQAYNNVVFHTADPTMVANTGDDGNAGSCIRLNNENLVAQVYNNTFVDCAVDGDTDSGGIRFQDALQATLLNNIFVGTKYFKDMGSGVGLPTGFPVTFTSTNNLWFGGGAKPSFDSASVTADPLFLSAAVGNYRVQVGSSAIDAGSTAVNGLVTNDFDGNPRPQGGAPDIGAFESFGVILPTPTGLQVIKK